MATCISPGAPHGGRPQLAPAPRTEAAHTPPRSPARRPRVAAAVTHADQDWESTICSWIEVIFRGGVELVFLFHLPAGRLKLECRNEQMIHHACRLDLSGELRKLGFRINCRVSGIRGFRFWG